MGFCGFGMCVICFLVVMVVGIGLVWLVGWLVLIVLLWGRAA